MQQAKEPVGPPDGGQFMGPAVRGPIGSCLRVRKHGHDNKGGRKRAFMPFSGGGRRYIQPVFPFHHNTIALWACASYRPTGPESPEQRMVYHSAVGAFIGWVGGIIMLEAKKNRLYRRFREKNISGAYLHCKYITAKAGRQLLSDFQAKCGLFRVFCHNDYD